MKVYSTEQIRNVGLLSHGGAGKTSLGEAMLFAAGATPRLGKVDDGSSALDFEPEDHKRGGSTKTAVAALEWKKHKINIVDTPGDSNFIVDTREALFAMDAALLLVSGVDGVEVGTMRYWRLLREVGRPVAIFVSKLDRERASFQRTLEEIAEQLEVQPVALQLPIGEEANLRGVVDLVHQRAYLGQEVGDVPADMADAVAEARSALMESVAETSEVLMEKFFEADELSTEELEQGLREAFAGGQLVPVLCGSALEGQGVEALLDTLVSVFPDPSKRPPVEAKVPGEEGAAVELTASVDEPMAAYVFKTIVDPYIGQITLARVISGKVASDGTLYDANTRSEERYSALHVAVGKKLESVSGANAGDIVAFVKLKQVRTRHTVCDKTRPVVVEWLPLPEPVISFAIVPRTHADEAKVSNAIARLLDEDPGLRVSRDDQTKEFLLSGMGQVHIETTVAKMERKFGVQVELKPPQVPYRETIRKKVAGIQARHKKQTGGSGEFAEVFVDVEPAERGAGYEFIDNIVGGAISRNFIPAVEKGFFEAMQRGYVAGFPVVDLRVRLYDGSTHPVDSSEIAFKKAAHLAFKKAMEAGNPCLLEPIMNLEIIVPEENMGDVMGNMSARRGKVLGMETRGKTAVVRAQAPLAEVLRYALDLRSMTSGRGEFTMEFSHYEIVPDNIAAKIIEERKQAAGSH